MNGSEGKASWRPRTIVRGLAAALVAVGVVAGTGIALRRARFEAIALGHEGQFHRAYNLARSGLASTPEVRMAWHRAMAGRYREAARRPWLPIGSDPASPP